MRYSLRSLLILMITVQVGLAMGLLLMTADLPLFFLAHVVVGLLVWPFALLWSYIDVVLAIAIVLTAVVMGIRWLLRDRKPRPA